MYLELILSDDHQKAENEETNLHNLFARRDLVDQANSLLRQLVDLYLGWLIANIHLRKKRIIIIN